MLQKIAGVPSVNQSQLVASKSTRSKVPRGPGAFGDMPYTQAGVLGSIRALEEFPAVAEGTVGAKYRFRAECQRDADLFLSSISSFIERNWTLTPLTYYPDVEGTFELAHEISPRDLLWVACAIVDCHVLAQTLDKEGDYNPERDYFRDIDIRNPEFMPSKEVMAKIKNGVTRYIKYLKHLQEDAKDFRVILKTFPSR